MIRIQIETVNAAFTDDKALETARILSELALNLNSARVYIPLGKALAHSLFDVNGNIVGKIWESR